MDMATYLNEIEFAATRHLETLWHERSLVDELGRRVADLKKRVEAEYEAVERIANDPFVPDDEGIATMRLWDNYFGPDREQFYANKDLQELIGRVAAHDFSVGTTAAALLHNGKQAISIVHHELKACPPGRAVGSQFLKDVIWQGRNQGQHWEEGARKPFRPAVEACFGRLAAEVDPKFADYRNRNMAFGVVELLGWKTWTAFRDDLMSLK